MNRPPLVVRNDWSSLPVPPLDGWTPTLPVSVVIPAYRCQSSLDLTLASLAAQTYPAHLLEVVVVDDGSEPALRLPDTRPEHTRLVRPNGDRWGIANACDHGVRVSAGEVVLRLDADMIVHPEHVAAHARWHQQVPYAVTLGTTSFVDVGPDDPHWPTPAVLARTGFDELFSPAHLRSHPYLDGLRERTNDLRDADHLGFLAHVGATVAVRRELYQAAGGYDLDLRRGSDTEFGYRLAQAGALFIPDRAARGWHLGLSTVMRGEADLHRTSRPDLADRMPQPRWLRQVGGSAWAVPLVVAVLTVGDGPLERVRATADALLRGDERDLRLCLVAPWSDVPETSRTMPDRFLDLALLRATYRSDPRVRLVESAPATVFPSPYRLDLPAAAGLSPAAVTRLLDELDRTQAGLVEVRLGADPDDADGPDRRVRLWRTAALGRARWLTDDAGPANTQPGSAHPATAPTGGAPTGGAPADGAPTDGVPTDGVPTDGAPTDGTAGTGWGDAELDEVVARIAGVRSLSPAAAGVIDLRRVPVDDLARHGAGVVAGLAPTAWLPATVEVGGLRSWLRATRLVATLAGRRITRITGINRLGRLGRRRP